MLQVMQEVGYVQKDGKNEFHGYKYASEANAIAALRPALVKVGLVMIPSVVNQERDEHGNTHVTVQYRIMDETGACIEFYCAGSGNDRARSGAIGDKGIYKALTGASKYALLKTFLLETGDDPEETTEADRDEPKTKSTKPKEEDKSLSADDSLFLEKLVEHAKTCATAAELTSLWKANLKQLNVVQETSKDGYEATKETFRQLKEKLQGAK